MVLVSRSICWIPALSLIRFVFQSVIPPELSKSRPGISPGAQSLFSDQIQIAEVPAGMKRVVALFLFAFPVAVFAAGPTRPVIVGLKSHIGRLTVKSLSTGVDPADPARHFYEYGAINAFSAELSDDEIAELKKASNVTYVEDVFTVHAFAAGLSSAALQPSADASAAQI